MIPSPILRALRAYVHYAPGGLGKPLLVARLLNEQLTRHPLTATARTRTGTVFPVVTDVIQRFIWLFGVWEPHLTAFISRRLAAGDTFIDVGADIGYFTVLAFHLPDTKAASPGDPGFRRCPLVRIGNSTLDLWSGRVSRPVCTANHAPRGTPGLFLTSSR